jgi:SAM-dependent methyltransferase
VPKLDDHYTDPRLVDLYDLENTSRADTDFYLALASELGAQRILDLGCGTGVLTRELATNSREVTGVDPSPAMLAYARRQPGAERVRWIEGDSSALGTSDADLVTMTGNVAQIFLDDADWQATLVAIHGALRPGGYLAFESRNPDARGWEQWTKADSYGKFDSPHGPVETWVDVVSAVDGLVSFEAHNVFEATGEDVVVESTLRFRTLDETTRSLNEVGFTVERVYGDWSRGAFTPTSRVMIFVARRD